MAVSTRFSMPRRGIGWLRRWGGARAEGFLFGGAVIGGGAAGVGVVLLMVANFVTVVGRKSPWAGAWLMGGLEVSELLMAMVSVLGGAYCWYRGGHVRIGLLRDRLGPRKRAGLDAVSALFFLIWLAAIAWGAWGVSLRYLISGSASMILGIPTAPFVIVFSLAMMYFAVVLLRSGIELVARVGGYNMEH